MAALCGCHRPPPPGAADLAPGSTARPGRFIDVSPRWSRDGRRVAYLRLTADHRARLYVATRDLARTVALLDPVQLNPDRPCRTGRAGLRAPEGLAWSPGDRHIVLPRVEWFTYEDGERLPGSGIGVYDLRTGALEQAATHPRHYRRGFYYYRSPAWSPDGARLAFVGEGTVGQTALFVKQLAGGPKIEVPRFDRYEDIEWPVWSPTGRLLAFRQGVLRSETANRVETVRVIEPGGVTAQRVVTLPGGRGEGPISGLCWSPDGTHLAFAVTRAGAPSEGAIWVVGVDGRQLRRVSPPDGRSYVCPVWVGGRRIAALRPAVHDYEVVLLGATAPGRPRVLCRVPTDDLDWSPDRRRIVCSTGPSETPAARTTLRVFGTGIHR